MWWRNVLALNTNQPINARRFPARAGCHCVTARSNKHWSFLFTLSWKLNHWFCLHGFYLRLNMTLVTFCSFSLHLMRRFQELGNFHFSFFLLCLGKCKRSDVMLLNLKVSWNTKVSLGHLAIEVKETMMRAKMQRLWTLFSGGFYTLILEYNR